MARLRDINSTAARALELLVLTGCRTGEIRNAQWSQFDLDKRLWIIPAELTKTGKKTGLDHTVPLSEQALSLLRSLPRTGDYVFPGRDAERVRDKAMGEVLEGLTSNGEVPHGFRSTFSDWAHDKTTFDHETIEHSLNHRIPDKVALAYRRGTGLEKRTKLMQSWADHCYGNTTADNVVSFNRA
jgi:integrase